MAYNKDNYENNRLTPKQEKFVEEIAKGKTQRQAYLVAYPNSKNYKENTIDSRASVLMKNKKIVKRLNELKQSTEKKVEWTRKKALETINYVMDMNKKDIERINEAFNTEIDLKEAKILELGQEMAQCTSIKELANLSKRMQNLTEEIAKLKKQRRTSGTNVHGIYEGAKILNRMFGYDITKVEIQQEDTERENLEQLSVEELRAIDYASKSRKNEDIEAES